MEYIVKTGPADTLDELMPRMAPELRGDLMTCGEMLRREGELRGRLETIDGFLRAGVGWPVIQSATGIDERTYRTLNATPPTGRTKPRRVDPCRSGLVHRRVPHARASGFAGACAMDAASLPPGYFKRQAPAILSACGSRGGRRRAARGAAPVRRRVRQLGLAAHPTYLHVGRELVRAAHGEDAPLVVDPFAGGGSIPLEACASARGVRQRPEPGRVPDPQGDAGGHPPARSGAGRRTAPG